MRQAAVHGLCLPSRGAAEFGRAWSGAVWMPENARTARVGPWRIALPDSTGAPMKRPLHCLVRSLPVWVLAGALLPCAAAEDWSGAITLISPYGPDYMGAAQSSFGLRPGLLVRYGRVTVSSGAGFAARREDREQRGLGVDLARSEQFRVSLGLRVDGGRQESSSPALAGLGDVKRTLRVRVGAVWDFAPDWTLIAGWTVDAFNRGGGNVADAKLQYDWHVGPRSTLTPSVALTVGGPRYMQTWFGVTQEQSAHSGYAEYDPGLGLRDLSLGLAAKVELGEHWVLVGGPGFTRVLGPAGRSPLVQRRSTWSASLGVGYRF